MTKVQVQQPLVAVVTPVYNGQNYLMRTLACVQAQTYPNLVHVVLDNASTDNTSEIITDTLGGRVSILTERNASLLPLVDNWNAAVAMTPPKTRYVKFLCADDLMRADCIERLVAVAESESNIQFVTSVDVFDDRVKPHGLDPTKVVYDGREIARRLLRGDIQWLPFPHLFFRVNAEYLKGPFNPETNPAPDADFVLRLLLHGNMGFVNAPLFYTRYHSASLTTRMGGDFLFLYTAIQRLDRYGGELLLPGESTRLRNGILRQILRHVIAWRAIGQTEIATDNLNRLAQFGFNPGALEYLTAILTWPHHKLRKTMQGIADRVVTLPTRVTESDFLDGAFAPQNANTPT